MSDFQANLRLKDATLGVPPQKKSTQSTLAKKVNPGCIANIQL